METTVLAVVVGVFVGGVCVLLLAMSAMLYAPTSQLFGRFPYRVKTTEKVLALTFDDGPNPPYTDELLRILKKHGVQATFFLVGKNLERYPQTGRDMAAAGHSIGNHTYSHAFSTNFSKSAFIREIERNQSVIMDITGITPTLFRPPWLYRVPWILKVLRTHQLTPISAVFGYELEVVRQRSKEIFRRALYKAKPGIILDFHDGYNAQGGYRQGTVDAIDQLIPALKSQGYTFVTVETLLSDNARAA